MNIKTAKQLLIEEGYLTKYDESQFLETIMKKFAMQFLDEAIHRYKESPGIGGTVKLLRELKKEVE